MLRHTLATLAYRAAKTLRGAPSGFGDYRAAPGTRSPVEILAHIGDLMDWAATMTRGQAVWHDATPLQWDGEVARFFASVKRLDDALAGDAPLSTPAEKIFQGPIADALTHVGQLNMLRRIAGAPVRGESYFRADIAAGRVGAEQAPPKKEFD